MKCKNCLRCGCNLQDHWSHICPSCGRFFAASTGPQIAFQLGLSTVVAIVLVVGLVVVLWRFS